MRAGARGFAAAFLFVALCAAFQSPDDGVTFDRDVAFIETADGSVHRFEVELAQTRAQRAKGLMFRESLADDAGMLFDFRPARDVGIWMRNTLISLDILYIRPDGTIARIEKGATPLSEEVMAAGEPVTGVLEIAAGRADALGVKTGDKVRFRWFAGARF